MRYQLHDRGHNCLGSNSQSAAFERENGRRERPTRQAGRYGMQMLLVLAMLGVTSSPAAAQALYGAVTGNVSDASGAPPANAEVTVVNTTTSESRVAATDDRGVYNVGNMAPGDYTIAIVKNGFERFQAKNLAVSIDSVSFLLTHRIVGLFRLV
jgi:hypothetical protein